MGGRRASFETCRTGLQERTGEIEARIRLYSHLWHCGPEAQAQIWNDIAGLLGAAAGRAALGALERYWAALDLQGAGARPGGCLCTRSELPALILGRVAFGDRATAARLCRRLAPAAETEDVLARAEEVARCFLGLSAPSEQEPASGPGPAVPASASPPSSPARTCGLRQSSSTRDPSR